MTDDTNSGHGLDVNSAIVRSSETSIEAAIKRAEAAPGSLPDFDTYERADEAARHVAFMLDSLLFPRPERDAKSGSSDGYVPQRPQRDRLQSREALDHEEQRSRQRVIDNASSNGGRL